MAVAILNSETKVVVHSLRIDCSYKDVFSMQNFAGELRSGKFLNSDAGIQDPILRWGEWEMILHPKAVRENSTGNGKYCHVSLEYCNSGDDGVQNKFLAMIKVSVVDGEGSVIQEWQVVGGSVPSMITTSYQEHAQRGKWYSCPRDSINSNVSGVFLYEKLTDARKAALGVGRDFKYLIDGNLRIIADIQIFLPSGATGRLRHAMPSLASQMVSQINCLFDSKAGADFVLVSNEGKKLPAHRSILIARSEVFKAMLTTDSKESQAGRCFAEDCDSSTLLALLEFVYGREPPNMADIAMKLLYAADKYQVLQLKELCEEQLASTLTVENAAKALILADNHTAELLRGRTITFVAANKKAFVKSGGFMEILKHSTELGNELMIQMV